MTVETQGVPPSIDGYQYERWLGGGGFADVFLYRQELPERRVAIKVLRETIDDDAQRGLFVAEANLMAKVSAHPNIVSIHAAGVSLDRRAFMVMEFYPLDHYGKRLELVRIPHDQVLDIGVKLAGAVDVAHQVRVVHRDIKPANILASDYGEPGLTDFGISATQFDTYTEESLGFSPPYAPKEILENSHPGDARSDVYSLAATLWAMLAGHSPFERPGERNTKGEVIARGINEPPPPLPAGAAPAALEQVLRQALEKDPDRRPQSARAFGQMLQGVERELGLAETRLVLLEDRSNMDGAVAQVEAAIEKTKQGRGVVVDLGASTIPGSTKPRNAAPAFPASAEASSVLDDRRSATFEPLRPVEPAGDKTSIRSSATSLRTTSTTDVTDTGGAGGATTSTRSKRRIWLGVGSVGILLAAAVGVAALGGSSDARPSSATSPPVPGEVVNPGLSGAVTVSAVANLIGQRTGETVTFSWDSQDVEGIDYIVRRIDAGNETTDTVEVSTITLDGVPASVAPCVTVTARVQGRAQSEPTSPVCVS